jgi:pimeloyl-ACP methyl ester carboxylesterase
VNTAGGARDRRGMEVCDDQPWEHADSLPGVRRLVYGNATDEESDWALYRQPAPGAGWVVVLHGHGSTGDQLFTRADIRAHWLQWLLAQGLGVLTPHLRGDAWMHAQAVAELHWLVEWLRTAQAARHLVLLGGSMGGTGALIYATRHPRDFQAVATLCPATDLARFHQELLGHDEWPRGAIRAALEAGYGGAPATGEDAYVRHSALAHVRRLTMSLYVAHGDQDPLIPVDHTERLRRAMPPDAPATFEILPGGGHDAPLTAPGLLPWLTRHTLPAKQSPYSSA